MTNDPYNLDLFYLWGRAQILLTNLNLKEVLDVLKAIGFFLTLALAILIMWVIFRSKGKVADKVEEIKMQLNPSQPGEGKYDAKWKEVLEHLTSVREAEWKFAVIEADKIVEAILQEAGFAGETMGDKMMAINQEQLSSINDLWEAHKLRNLIAHDSDSQVKYVEVRRAIEQYEKTLRELGALG